MRTRAIFLVIALCLTTAVGYALRYQFVEVAHRWGAHLPWATTAQAAAAAPPASPAGERKILYYQDPMHPSYKSDKPGIAPDCGMQLVPVYASDEGSAPSAPASGTAVNDRGPVQISSAQAGMIGLATAKAQYRTLDQTLRAVATVALNEQRTGQVHTRISGWIQKVFVDYETQQVNKGQPLFTLYSPDVVATEQEYLLAIKGQRELGGSPYAEISRGADSLVEAARQRLSLYDLSDDQVREIERRGQPMREFTIYSPISGRVTERKAFPNQYVSPDMNLYTIVDYGDVWVYADFYEPEVQFLRTGQDAVFTTDAYPGKRFAGKIDYVMPQFDMQTRTLKVRMDLPNPELALKPDMFGNVEIHIPLGRRLVVPDSAILDTGLRTLVFVQKSPGSLEPRTVQTGVHAGDYVEIVQGLKAGEAVASSATFLIDSESQLRANLSGANLGTGVTGIGGQAAPSSQNAAPQGAAGQLQISIHTNPDPPKSGLNALKVSVRDASGRPVDGAQVTVTFYIPAMPDRKSVV